MGLGDAMYEEMVYGDGQLLNGDSFQYRLSLLHDLPPRFISIMVENHDGPGPLGAKGMLRCHSVVKCCVRVGRRCRW